MARRAEVEHAAEVAFHDRQAFHEVDGGPVEEEVVLAGGDGAREAAPDQGAIEDVGGLGLCCHGGDMATRPGSVKGLRRPDPGFGR